MVKFSINVKGKVLCSQGGWKKEDWYQVGTYNPSALGRCWGALEDEEPWCLPFFGYPSIVDQNQEGVDMTGWYADATYNSNGCGFASDVETPEYNFPISDCCGSYCMDPDGCNLKGEWDGANCQCVMSPVVLDLDGNGFHLTGPDDPVEFDLACSDSKASTSWTASGEGDAFLVLDRNGNGLVDSGCELFGSATTQPKSEHRNGFDALRAFDVNGDNRINHLDPIFSSLQVWTDANHDGRSDAGELKSLSAVGVMEISLDYRTTWRRDQHGNQFRYLSEVRVVKNGRVHRRNTYDVFLVANRPRGCAVPKAGPAPGQPRSSSR